MWISVVPGTRSGPDLQVPAPVWRGPAGQISLRYGARTVRATVSVRKLDLEATWDREHPAEVVVHPHLIRRLNLRTEPVYQLRSSSTGSELEIGPVLGLLLGPRNHWYNGAFLEREPERVMPAYALTGGLYCAFSPRNVSVIDQAAYGLLYDPAAQEWRFGTLPLPSVVHRRSFQSDAALIRRLNRLSVRVFNSWRYSKWEVHQILSKDRKFRPYLPDTALLKDGTEALHLLERHGSVILKPSDLSRGRGILFVERQDCSYTVLDCRQEAPPSPVAFHRQALVSLLSGLARTRPYLCQRKLELARLGGAPFDIRAVMQRGYGSGAGSWHCTGIECRLAGQGYLVTNISRGGRALWLKEAVAGAFAGRLDPVETERTVVSVATRVCTDLERTGQDYGEFGIDLALDRSGQLWFIEANVIPTFHGFIGLDRNLYAEILSTPLLYAGCLAGFGPNGHVSLTEGGARPWTG